MKRGGGTLPFRISLALMPILIVVGGLTGCTGDKTQDTWTVVACWLRPSCLPSQLPSQSSSPQNRQAAPPPEQPPQSITKPSPKPTPAPVTASSRPSGTTEATPSSRNPSGSPSPNSSSPPRLLTCQPFASLTVPPERTSVQISYREPTQRSDGTPLTDLVKTTIFQDSGQGFVKVKDVKATEETGGGLIQETIPILDKTETARTIRICVTATNAVGQTSAGSP